MNNGDMPASPIDLDAMIPPADGFPFNYPLGLTKRERFAMAAMQGIMSRDCGSAYNSLNLHVVAKSAVTAADALLAELAKGQSK